MSTKWKYVENVDKKLIENIEKYFNIKLPDDYKKLLKECNRGKPEKDQFDILLRKGCVLDYLVDLNEVIGTSERIGEKKLIPIGSDPFGNIIAFNINSSRSIDSVVFWDHETNSKSELSNTFSEFISMLY